MLPETGVVYLWRDFKRGMFYIGSHWGQKRYVCSSPRMLRAYKRRPQDFKREVLQIVTTSRTDLLVEEEGWLQLIPKEELGRSFYNLNRHILNYWHTDPNRRLTIGQKISLGNKGKTKGRPKTEAHRLAMAAGKRGVKVSEIGRMNIAAANRGRTTSPETKLKLSIIALGKPKPPRSEAHKAALRKPKRNSSRMGRPRKVAA